MDKVKETDITVAEHADLVADADERSGEIVDQKKIEIPFMVKLSRSYDDGNGNQINEVDLSGLENMTTMDAQEVDRIVGRLGYTPKNKWRDTLYTKHVAVRATGMPVEFFNALSWKDMEEISSVVMLYFLFG